MLQLASLGCGVFDCLMQARHNRHPDTSVHLAHLCDLTPEMVFRVVGGSFQGLNKVTLKIPDMKDIGGEKTALWLSSTHAYFLGDIVSVQLLKEFERSKMDFRHFLVALLFLIFIYDVALGLIFFPFFVVFYLLYRIFATGETVVIKKHVSLRFSDDTQLVVELSTQERLPYFK